LNLQQNLFLGFRIGFLEFLRVGCTESDVRGTK